MKQTTLALALLATAATASAQQFTVVGTAPDGAAKVYLAPISEDPIDSVEIGEARSFTFKGDAQGKRLAYVYTRGEGATRFAVVLDGQVEVDLAEGHASGSEENTLLSAYQEFDKQTYAPLTPLYQSIVERRQRGEQVADEEIEAFYSLADSLSNVVQARAKSDLETYKNMRFPAYILIDNINELSHDYILSLDKPDALYMGEPCLKRVRTMFDAWRRTQTGAKFADFEMADTTGAMRKLSEFVGRGTYVLLDFWATWCGPCMRELPNVKALYDQYHAKGFDIVGISFDQDGEAWRNVIKRRQMNWTHLSDLQGWKSLPVEFYGVRAIPFTMLISPDGTILETGLTGEALATKLAEIFGGN
ncbi:MAG: AhpC/TSA family protein [Bacteroidaceae bacterium]|nr:AhpC/TSA family protein [Bacteroidaceae bacterium]